MNRFYFHLDECGVVTDDSEGLEVDSLEAAMVLARDGARDLMAADVHRGTLCLDSYIVVEKSGAEVGRVYFSELLMLTVGGTGPSSARIADVVHELALALDRLRRFARPTRQQAD
jgi:hypothetical protein